MDLEKYSQENIKVLGSNDYPGRGIIIGMTPDESQIAQIYWTMGRSENSRNRIFTMQGDNVRTEAFDESKMEDPSLIIYNCTREYKGAHIVANGDQSDTVYNGILNQVSFQNALESREYEPDDPNCTPRITGLVDLAEGGYRLSILKSIKNIKGMHSKNFYRYPRFLPGYGHMIHTYEKDGSPLPSFPGDPLIVTILQGQEENLDFYWNLINDENKVSLLVKYIDVKTKEVRIIMKNKLP